MTSPPTADEAETGLASAVQQLLGRQCVRTVFGPNTGLSILLDFGPLVERKRAIGGPGLTDDESLLVGECTLYVDGGWSLSEPTSVSVATADEGVAAVRTLEGRTVTSVKLRSASSSLDVLFGDVELHVLGTQPPASESHDTAYNVSTRALIYSVKIDGQVVSEVRTAVGRG